ncbi:trifunctional transcriptional regulator/proline dehydrogenase/L-glutamate gamma-semialdehyde dehydrogenase [Methylobacterium sp. NEAU K]|uniref:trifunctional transcriptional regulator/proline dehydrogenase/L-glutamate gamma-semialdehyde dehydrogenase n=1 Tax=Methylobacterium sp. NEAU K TaxID=3064946 RepID=UPI002734FE94|nr:trifunctional transcriptional regulator/proline dehydrogenase/L-glutamate gamma-semialdehyde dehydrogenase [Methylobacterium sp. NEAU K]MDP4002355.1 trifunctional transcriptional regulator/proline dehydrogenase/L-glutamate gamma-semialdehyde dehydrogenase [Methylobacterium sp. NEAU K]
MSGSGIPDPAAAAQSPPFGAFASELPDLSPLRAAVVAACRRPEPDCIVPLLDLGRLAPEAARRVAGTARSLVETLRRQSRRGGVEGLIHEYSLSSQEGVALMCLAEALLRIPDAATRDALIRDKIAGGDWAAHLGHSPSPFVNAATWGLVVTGRLVATRSEAGLAAALTRLIGRGGEPLIRKAVDLAMRMMGEQFVTGRTIAEAIRNATPMEAKGFTYSYDMLGEAAVTAEDADRYLRSYEEAIQAIGAASAGRGVLAGPGISIKLSALHPRYVRSKRGRVMAELVPRVLGLARLAKHCDIGLNIDAEEADRLDLSLDILETLAVDPELTGWDGLGFVVQAYGKRCPYVIDVLVDLARRSRRRLMVRLVKGAYWDSEIKRAQADGLDGFPVYTRKVYTDVSYLACARKLLSAPDAVFPQFATHNAQTLASIIEMAGPDFRLGQYEFQCLHGMGEPLYEAVVGAGRLGRPCRIYAPVGTHETLLAYLVRRLLENGANTSFVNRVGDATVPVEVLIADPVAAVEAMPVPGAPHPGIALPRDLYGPPRANAAGLDLADEAALERLVDALAEGGRTPWIALPSGADPDSADASVCNPADHRDVVGRCRAASPDEIERALARAEAAAGAWGAKEPAARAACLRRAADALEARMPVLIGLVVREAGKSFGNAVAELREAVDFLRYYAVEAERTLEGTSPLGPVVCIAPWNFPLAIFMGQVAAALAAGNAVLAKPAEETPLIAAEAVRALHGAGVPEDALQFLPGAGEVGAALVEDPRVQGVMFTGSTAVAKTIQRRLAERLSRDGEPVPLIAETGGQNAMVVDSSALAEQVVADVIASAFDSAGQRCSALRILCLQAEIAERTLRMLKCAMRELDVGDPRRLAADVGPVITREAADRIGDHVAAMRSRGFSVEQVPLPRGAALGTFVPPTLIEIDSVSDVESEIFGPVLHVLRYGREDLDRLLTEIDATGYGLTFGLHTRIDETVERVLGRVGAGNRYVNRNVIGAVVGVQPFGGSGLSGTGPKAGGPLYLGRLVKRPPAAALAGFPGGDSSPVCRYADWLRSRGQPGLADRVSAMRCPAGAEMELAGPVGERNLYALHPRGRIAAIARTEHGLLIQLGSILATGNRAVAIAPDRIVDVLRDLPAGLAGRIEPAPRLEDAGDVRAILFEGDLAGLRTVNRAVAARLGRILPVQGRTPEALAGGDDYALTGLVEERSTSINTAAAGGNASLMAIG